MRLFLFVSLLAATGGGACNSPDPASSTPPASDGGSGGSSSNDSGAPPLVDAAGADTDNPTPSDDGGSTPIVDASPVIDTPPAPVPDAAADASTDTPPGGSARVLIYTRTTGQRHDSIPVAADYIGRAARAAGLMTETSEDPAKFTTAGLAPYGAIVLLATTGEPFGPGTTGIDALAAWLKAGGALIGIENATHAYDTSATYVGLLGGDFAGHPGDYTTATCTKVGNHPSVAMLPATFRVTDEIYSFTQFRMDNQIVLRCAADNRPVSWYREEGAGRVFYTALGHANESWTLPPLVPQHVLPGLLWAMRR